MARQKPFPKQKPEIIKKPKTVETENTKPKKPPPKFKKKLGGALILGPKERYTAPGEFLSDGQHAMTWSELWLL